MDDAPEAIGVGQRQLIGFRSEKQAQTEEAEYHRQHKHAPGKSAIMESAIEVKDGENPGQDEHPADGPLESEVDGLSGEAGGAEEEAQEIKDAPRAELAPYFQAQRRRIAGGETDQRDSVHTFPRLDGVGQVSNLPNSRQVRNLPHMQNGIIAEKPPRRPCRAIPEASPPVRPRRHPDATAPAIPSAPNARTACAGVPHRLRTQAQEDAFQPTARPIVRK